MKKGLLILAAAAAMLFAGPAQAQKKSSVLDIKQSITDDAIVFPESFEADTQAMLEGWYMKNYTATDDRYRTSPDVNVSDEVIIERLKNIPSVIEMPFNQVVRKYIDRYTKNGRKLVTVCLGLGNYYLPIIEQALEAEGLPLELKYLPMIESAFNPNAVSRAGATGLWQFMLSAAKGYDMEVSSLVDERRDPFESSKKGAKLLKDLYNTYGKWDLAIAAYNCGPGNVNKAIRRAGGDPAQHDFWSIYNYLPKETRGYFPMFIAANYIMTYYQDHNISPVVPTKPLVTDTVAVNTRINLNQISHVLDIPMDELRLLNPQFRADVIPGNSQRRYMLILPSRQISAYIMSEQEIMNYDAAKYARRAVADPGSLPKETDLADNGSPDQAPAEQPANVNDDLLAMEPENNDTDDDYRKMRETSQRKEQEARQRHQSAQTPPPATTNAAGQTIHKVAVGESLQSIAEMYQISQDQLKLWNNLKRNSVRVGQQLIVRTNTSVSSGNSRQRSQSKSVSSSGNAQTAPSPAAKPARKSQQSTSATATSSAGKSKKADAAAADSGKSKVKKNNKKNSTETASTSKKDKKTRNKKKAAQAKPTTHEVKNGESLEKIAKRHGVTVDELRKANKLKGDVIHAGDDLKIPSKSKSAKATKSNKKGAKADKASKSSKSSKSSSKSSKSGKSKKKKK